MHDIGIDKMYNVWHANENNILIYFHDGDGSVVFVDKIYPIQKGAFCFIPSRKQHYTIPADTYTYNRSKIMITDELLNNILAFDRNTNLSVFNQVRYANLPVESQKKIEGILAELEEQDSDSRGYYFLYISAIFRCFSILNANETKDPDLKIDLVVRVMEYVHSHINQPISIEQICSYLNFNKYYVCHKFKDIVGVSIMKYVLNTRLSLASEKLISSTLSITEIAMKCGFSDTSEFCHQFKKAKNITAKQYRINGRLF